MEQTQNTSPQEPKKSFWAKLFGGGKSDPAPAATPEPPTSNTPSSASSAMDPTASPTAASTPNNSDTSSPLSSSTPPSDWDMPAASTDSTNQTGSSPEPAVASASEAGDTSSVVTEPPVVPIPSWRDVPASQPASSDSPATEPASNMPVPPSDPMVTPVQPTESATYDGAASVPASSETPNPVHNDTTAQSSQAQPDDDSQENDRPSIIPPER